MASGRGEARSTTPPSIRTPIPSRAGSRMHVWCPTERSTVPTIASSSCRITAWPVRRHQPTRATRSTGLRHKPNRARRSNGSCLPRCGRSSAACPAIYRYSSKMSSNRKIGGRGAVTSRTDDSRYRSDLRAALLVVHNRARGYAPLADGSDSVGPSRPTLTISSRTTQSIGARSEIEKLSIQRGATPMRPLPRRRRLL